jgi:FAD/FMN-containing dehydrogenase
MAREHRTTHEQLQPWSALQRLRRETDPLLRIGDDEPPASAGDIPVYWKFDRRHAERISHLSRVRHTTPPMDTPSGRFKSGSGRTPRRKFLAGAAALGAFAWVPVLRISPASAQATCAPPPAFPPGIPLYQQAYENWSGEIAVDSLWTCAPTSPTDVVAIVNWAHENGWRIRPRGFAHNWSPLSVTPGTTSDTPVVLVDTTQHLTTIAISPSPSPARVTAQTGTSLEALLTTLERSGYGLAATPAPGDITLGGALAIDAHGTAVPAHGESRPPGHGYGSLSNLILSLTAIVWDPASTRYAQRTFDRCDPEIRPLLAHLGRAFLTEVTLQIGSNQRLRCQSFIDIPTDELFAAPGSGASRTFAGYLESAGRAEIIWFPFTLCPWLKVWSVRPIKPLSSREVKAPFNYVFADIIPPTVSDVADQLVTGAGLLTPLFSQLLYDLAATGLLTTATLDLWGWSKNLLLYVRPTTLRMAENGYAILTRRSDIQRVIHEFKVWYSQHLAAYQAQGLYPMNGPVEIRVTGLDQPAEVEVPSAGPPLLSALRPRPDHPEWDVIVWLDVLTLPGTPLATTFYRELEQWIFANYSGSYAAVRPEWSKGWAYTTTAAWSDPDVMATMIPDAYRAGQPPEDTWDAALDALDELDPHRIFSNAFLDVLLP